VALIGFTVYAAVILAAVVGIACVVLIVGGLINEITS
jgi:hypothetical protein